VVKVRFERVVLEMSESVVDKVRFYYMLWLGTAVLLAIASPVAICQGKVPDWETAAGGKMSFEVASVRPSKPGSFTLGNVGMNGEDDFRPTGGLLNADLTLETYIKFAYKLLLTEDQTGAMLARLPKWVSNERFSINARAPGDPTKDQYRLMMQSLLADRFGLKVHFEPREEPVLALTLVQGEKLGPKIRPHADGPACDASDQSTEQHPFTCGKFNLIREPDNKFLWGARDARLSVLAFELSILPPRNLGRPVVDQTGLTGTFDFTLEWTALPRTNPDTPSGTEAEQSFQGSTLEEALKQQLGMKLKSTRAPVQTLVIDHVEMLAEN
jgi:bla regulator protein BlaR1